MIRGENRRGEIVIRRCFACGGPGQHRVTGSFKTTGYWIPVDGFACEEHESSVVSRKKAAKPFSLWCLLRGHRRDPDSSMTSWSDGFCEDCRWKE